MRHHAGQVEVWIEKIEIPTYEVGEPDKNPMFLEKRVYQGSSGKVYPIPVIDKIYDEKIKKEYQCIWLENDFLKIMVLPELGGRIQRAYDKTNRYDFVYYNRVIKPALVGLAGPWISGGIEFNWPQHHRPTTFLPVDFELKENQDGSKSVYLSEVDQMYGTKGMAVFTLYPDLAYLEIKGQLYNRTDFPQTFLWWANPAVAVNDHTQSIFPPDVNAVMDHGKRAVSKFPIATGVYYKHDYGMGVDISRYKNIPVPTSYMAYHSDFDFVGGYDYQKEAGILHIADHHISPGKKQWTWGNGEFGRAWDRNLTDEDGPYIELMTGVYTDNQPDFSWLKPFEEKTFVQYFMPYKKAGNVKNANKKLILNLDINDHTAYICLYGTSRKRHVQIYLYGKEKELLKASVSVSPNEIFEEKADISGYKESEVHVKVLGENGEELISYTPAEYKIPEFPKAMEAAKKPTDIFTCEELYLTGMHIEQYRHATYQPDDYYLEGLKRDRNDIRLNLAYGMLLLKRGLFKEAEERFRTAIKRLIWKNPNPYNSEAFYDLGLSLFYQERYEEAYDAFYKAVWTSEQQEMSYYYLAVLEARKGKYQEALEFLEKSLAKNACNMRGRALKCMLLRKLGKKKESLQHAEENLRFDPFDYVSAWEIYGYSKMEHMDVLWKKIQNRESTFIEMAIDYGRCGFYQEAVDILNHYTGKKPMIHYYKAHFLWLSGKEKDSMRELKAGAEASPLYCFPNRPEDIRVLLFSIKHNKTDHLSPYYLGNLYYDKKRYTDAFEMWKKSVEIRDDFPTVYRNLSFVYYNKLENKERAFACMEKAFQLDPSDARVLLELDQLLKKMNKPLDLRLNQLQKHMDLVTGRDDLYTEYVSLLNAAGSYEKAYSEIIRHKFHPWEGGEGKITMQYKISLIQMAVKCIFGQRYNEAEDLLKKALYYPENLGEGKLEGSKDNDIYYYLGCIYEKKGDFERAKESFKKASYGAEELAGAMYYYDQPADMILFQGLACEKLGNEQEAVSKFHKLIDYGESHFYDHMEIDYFAVSIPDLQLFEDDLNLKNQIHCNYLIGLGNMGLGNINKSKRYMDKVLKDNCGHAGALFQPVKVA